MPPQKQPPTKRSPLWPKVKRRAFARDKAKNAPCALCKQPIDYSLGMSSNKKGQYNPRAYEPDHILPVKEHPELELDLGNIQAAHAGCNRSKQNKAGMNVLGNASRDWWND